MSRLIGHAPCAGSFPPSRKSPFLHVLDDHTSGSARFGRTTLLNRRGGSKWFVQIFRVISILAAEMEACLSAGRFVCLWACRRLSGLCLFTARHRQVPHRLGRNPRYSSHSLRSRTN